jgi:hypothetical protein
MLERQRLPNLHVLATTIDGSNVTDFLQFVAGPDELQDERVLADFTLELPLNFGVQNLDLLLAVDLFAGLDLRLLGSCLHEYWCWYDFFLLDYDRLGSSFNFGGRLGKLLGLNWSGGLLGRRSNGFYFRGFDMIFGLLLRNCLNRLGLFFGGFFNLWL